jgi:hypothetical protein
MQTPSGTLSKRIFVLTLIAWLLCLSALAGADTPPGEVITLTATVSADGARQSSTWHRLIVLNPLFKDRVFYVCKSWRDAMPGLRIRWNQCVGLGYITCEGVTTNTGKILTEAGGLIELDRVNGRF